MPEAAQLHLGDEAAVTALAQRLAPVLNEGGVVELQGDLGAGKTTFARALLGALGVSGRVKSPTYSLIESYRLPALAIHHLDLYRIADPGELDWLGLEELQDEASLILFEWPERGGDHLPPADLRIALAHAAQGRDARLLPLSERGRHWLKAASLLDSGA